MAQRCIYQPHLRKRILTERRKKILDFCRKYIAEYGWAPSITEIRREVGIRSKASAYQDMYALMDLEKIIFAGTRQIKVL